MTYHLLFATLALMLAAATLQVQLRGIAQPAYAPALHGAASASSPGFSGAFGSGAAVRNLLF